MVHFYYGAQNLYQELILTTKGILNKKALWGQGFQINKMT
jgi:hypothetical protein